MILSTLVAPYQAQAQAAAERYIYSAVSRLMSGVDRFIADPRVEPRVGQMVYEVAQSTHPDRLLTSMPERVLSGVFAWAGHPIDVSTRPLSAWQTREYVARHLALSALIAPAVVGFLYGANPEGVRFTAVDLKAVVRRYFELVERDASNAGRFYPRRILSVAFGDLERDRAMNATYRTSRQMREAIRARVGYVDDRRDYDASIWPAYFRNLFHWRDWFDDASAFSWDTKTELLFQGLYGAMQRSAIRGTMAALNRMETVRRLEARSGPLKIVEVGAGTGTFANYLLETARWSGRIPSLDYGFVEMSPSNMKLARERLSRWGSQVRFLDYEHDRAAAENLPYEDGTVDSVVVINLFHELPPNVREEAAWEIARVLRHRGRLIFFDSIQMGDGVDSFLTAFGESGHGKQTRVGVFHEPYIPGYARTDLTKLFESAGLNRVGEWEHAYLAKGAEFEKI